MVECSGCNFYHPFFYGNHGDIVHLTPGNHRDLGNMAREYGVKTQEIKENHIFICRCGNIIKVL